MRLACAVLAVTGCGRLAFDARDDATSSTTMQDGSSAGLSDGAIDASSDAAPCPPLLCGAAVTSMNCNGRCLTHCSEQVFESEAQSRCNAWGGTIATIHSQADNDCAALVAPTQSWIGYTQSGGTVLAANWSWLDGQVSAYVNWGPGEPQDADSIENGQEQCAFINPG